MSRLAERLREVAQRDIHEHLEPIEKYGELDYKRLFRASARARVP